MGNTKDLEAGETAIHPVPDLSLRRVSRVLKVIAGGLGIVLAGLICGRLASSHYGPAVLEASAGITFLIVIARRPALVVMLLLVVVASAFSYGSLPRVPLPGHPPVNIGDVLLATAVGGTFWRVPWRDWPAVVRRYLAALVVVLLLAGVATIKASLLGSTEAREALYSYRNFLYLGVALTIALELYGPQWRLFLNLAVAYAAALSIISLVAAASAHVAHDVAGLATNTITTSAEAAGAGDTGRVRLVGLYYIYALLLPTLVLVLTVRDRWRLLRLLALLAMIGAVGVSLNRNMYAGGLVGVVITAALGGPRVRQIVASATLATAAVVVLLVLASFGPAIGSEIGSRSSTLLSPTQLLASGSLRDRAYEDSYAVPSVGDHPWFGVGPRQFYGAYLVTNEIRRVRFFVQNLPLDLATDYGIPTALAFLLIPGICLLFGANCIRWAGDPTDRALLAACIGTVVAMLLGCLVGTYLQDPETTVAFGVACGLLMMAGRRTLPGLGLGVAK
jgi:hypothetical protein